MKLRPLHDRVIVKRLEEERQSAGGIVIPDTAAEKPSMGKVVAVGPGKTDENGKLQKMGVKAGDKIRFVIQRNGANRADPIVWDPAIILRDPNQSSR